MPKLPPGKTGLYVVISEDTMRILRKYAVREAVRQRRMRGVISEIVEKAIRHYIMFKIIEEGIEDEFMEG